jgi:hypothetical protein
MRLFAEPEPVVKIQDLEPRLFEIVAYNNNTQVSIEVDCYTCLYSPFLLVHYYMKI